MNHFNYQNIISFIQKYSNNLSIDILDIIQKINIKNFNNVHSILDEIVSFSIKSVSVQNPDYDKLASIAQILSIRYYVFQTFDMTYIDYYEYIVSMVNKNLYDSKILEMYSKYEIDQIGKLIDHDRDFNISYAGIKQMANKYLVVDRLNNKIFETPQLLYMSIAIMFASKEEKDRIAVAKKYYDHISNFNFSLSTPILSGLRTNIKQFSSCILIDSDDSLDSINAVASTCTKYISHRGGIGINASRIRSIGSPIRKGEAVHTGVIPFLKYWQSAIKSCSQGGIRAGAGTVFFAIWHYEIESLIVLKNNRGVEENRVRHLDYCFQINRYLYKRLQNNEHITLFNPQDVPQLLEAFYKDQDLFAQLYEKYEQDPKIKQKTIDAYSLFTNLAIERMQTGRIYIQNIDHSNTHSSFITDLAPITQSNLCVEITLPTSPIDSIEKHNTGEISLCTLAAINLGNIQKLSDLEDICMYAVKALNFIIDYQIYLHPSAKFSTMFRRPLGIGITNLSYYLAKNNVKYSDNSANDLVHKTMEAFQYYLLKASNKLAKEQGPCSGFNQTKYSIGLLPIDHYQKTVDEICNFPLQMDWEQLRSDIKSYGLRNSTLSAIMPCESSSVVIGSTNGIELPRNIISIKANKDGQYYQLLPQIKILKDKYEFMFDPGTNKGYLQVCAIIQKFIDQSISVNTSYDPNEYENNKVSVSAIIEDMLFAYYYGLKTLYYCNTKSESAFDYDKELKSKTINQQCEVCSL